MVNSFLSRVLDGVFPHYCVLCGLLSNGDFPLCEPCRGCLVRNRVFCCCCALPLAASSCSRSRLCGNCLRNPPPFDRVIAPFLYDEHLAYLIGRWKFHREHRLGSLMAALWLADDPVITDVDVLLPVPLHWRKLLQRGFNQAEQLAGELRRRHPLIAGIRNGDGWARRSQPTAAQAGLKAAARRRNLHGAFTMRRRCDNLRIAIVDDVVTTGATASALAAVLRAAGACHVEVWCLARTPAPPT